MPVAISIRYRPNWAALSDVPRAASTTKRGRSFSNREHSARAALISSRRAASRTAGCSRISSSISDMGFEFVGQTRWSAAAAPGGAVPARSAPQGLEVELQAQLHVAGANRSIYDAFARAAEDVHGVAAQRKD